MARPALRTPLWDNLRFALMFLVVLGHAAGYYAEQSEYLRMLFFFIYTFHMPAFIFISGMFCKRTVNEKDYARVASYLVLYVFIKITSYISSLCMYGRGSFVLLTEGGIPWYAFALFAFSLLTIFLKRFNPLYVFVVSVVLACFAGYDSSLGDKLVLLRIITYFPFFFAGYLLEPERALAFLKKRAVTAAAFVIMSALLVCVCLFIGSLYDLRPLLSGRNPYSVMPAPYAAFGGLLRAAYFAVVFILIGCVISLTPQGKTFLTAFGSRTVQAYALHNIFLRLFDYLAAEPLARAVGISSPLMAFALMPVALAVTMLCSLKIFEKPFALLLSPGKCKR